MINILCRYCLATMKARQLYKSRLDVRYAGDTDNQLLDIYYKNEEHCK